MSALTVLGLYAGIGLATAWLWWRFETPELSPPSRSPFFYLFVALAFPATLLMWGIGWMESWEVPEVPSHAAWSAGRAQRRRAREEARSRPREVDPVETERAP